MPRFICLGCGVQHDDAPTPPERCDICADERQYVRWEGQAWTTHEALARTHRLRLAVDGDLLGIGIEPGFAIPQRALWLPTDAGNVLWECTSLVTPDAVEALEARGGVDMIALSHPHFYSAMVEWSEAFGGVPIWLHEADRAWVRRPGPNLRFWGGDSLALSRDVRLIHVPGHFPGSTALHWRGAPRGRSVLLPGDALHVSQDRRHVSFMYSVPNRIPLHPERVAALRARLADVDFDDIYGFTWGLNILGDARRAVDASFERYLKAVGAGA
jgi:glyoxylase-like metal-dependent hydrolase (beta-lactamase superfamily II)